MSEKLNEKQFHFIGIGGVGMSGIAKVAAQQGARVSGSDIRESTYTKALIAQGVEVFIGHDAQNIPAGDVTVVVSTAIMSHNPELMEAFRRGLTIWHRAQMLSYLGRNLKTLAVAGTHGKTTSSSMLAYVMHSLGLDPTFAVGGIVRDFGSNAHCGTGSMYVVEADESDKSFTYLSPFAVLLTNIEADHLDHYRDLNEIYSLFKTFMGSVPADGVLVACADDAPLLSLARSTGKPLVSYGFSSESSYCICECEAQGVAMKFSLRLPTGKLLNVRLRKSPGRHNVANAAGVLAMCDVLGFDVENAAAAIEGFSGAKRRFEVVGSQCGVTVVDDYAHHPTEIAATVAAACNLGYKRVHVLFQPHRYSRASLFTVLLHDEFSSAFDGVDLLTFMDVYPAGEPPVPGISGKTFLDVVRENPHAPESFYIARRTDVIPHLLSTLEDGDLLITMGAGDVSSIGGVLLDALRKTGCAAQDAAAGGARDKSSVSTEDFEM